MMLTWPDHNRYKHRCLGMVLCLLTMATYAQEVKPAATEDWSVKPPVVTPAPQVGGTPSDAIILFAKAADITQWEDLAGKPVSWVVKKNTLQIVKDAGDIQTKQSFGSVQLHAEWKTPDPEEDGSTSRGNSGIFFMGLYELQIYESYQYQTKLYYNGMAGSIYKQHTPLVNACRPPQTWQTFDVVFEAPVFKEDKSLLTPAYITVFQNGILILNHVALKGPTLYAGYPSYQYHESKLPLRLQEHDSRVSFRNLWVRSLD